MRHPLKLIVDREEDRKRGRQLSPQQIAAEPPCQSCSNFSTAACTAGAFRNCSATSTGSVMAAARQQALQRPRGVLKLAASTCADGACRLSSCCSSCTISIPSPPARPPD